MTEPIPPISDSNHIIGPRYLCGRRGMAAAIICPDGYPLAVQAQREVLEQARQLINESFKRRRVPTPPRGWTLGLIHPDEQWRDHLAPELVTRITADLTKQPAGAVVAVVVAFDTSEEN